MQVIGIDFTSAPSRRKPITALSCSFNGETLSAGSLEEWSSFDGFEEALERPGPWIAGIDFPFGQSRKFVENMGWPLSWPDYVALVGKLDRQGFRQTLLDYKKDRPQGDKEHRRETDTRARSISPQKLYGVPVALMFFEGAPRLLRSGASIPNILEGDRARIVVEAYPGVLARSLIERRSYKSDTKRKQTPEQTEARRDLFQKLRANSEELYGFTVEAPQDICDDPGADHLDTLLCAVQAAWAWSQRTNGYGAPEGLDALEGYIADPQLIRT